MESLVVKGERREAAGRRAAGRVRRKGLVPAVIYGHGEPPVSVALEREQLTHHLHGGAHLLDVEMDGQTSKLLVKDVQYDHLNESIIHVDLARVSLDERVEVTVPLHFRGVPAGVKLDGGQLLTPLTEVEIECLVIAIPGEIRVNVAALKIGDQLTLADLTLPEGVRMLGNPEQVVALVAEPKAAEVAPAAEAEAPAEPEVIGRKAAEEGAEAEEPPAKGKGEK